MFIHGGFVFDWCQTAESCLSATAVIGAFDPGNDRDPEFIPGCLAALVQNVLLEQADERFHCRVITGSANPTHRPDQVVLVEHAESSIGMFLDFVRQHPEGVSLTIRNAHIDHQAVVEKLHNVDSLVTA